LAKSTRPKQKAATATAARTSAYQSAIAAFKAELALSPVTTQTIALTGDQANNAHVHWELARSLTNNSDKPNNQISELNAYLLATQWHSDVYPWRITVAKNKIATLSGASVPGDTPGTNTPGKIVQPVRPTTGAIWVEGLSNPGVHR